MRQKGQNLTDYTLILGLIAIVALGGLVVFSEQLKTFFDNRQAEIMNSTGNQSSTSGGITVGGQTGGSSTGSTAGSAGTTPAGGSTTVAGGAGSLGFLGAARSGADLGNLVETSGVNGTLTSLASTLEQQAKVLLDSGKIDQMGYNQTMEMANKAHRLGAAAGVLETATSACAGDSSCLASLSDTNVTFEGKPILYKYLKGFISSTHGQTNSVDSLNSDMNTCPGCGTGKEVLLSNPGSSGYAMLREFTTQWGVVQGVVANDPVLKRQLDELGTQVYITTARLSSAAGDPAGNPTLATSVASELNHYNAGTICDKGGGKDSGAQCSPTASAAATPSSTNNDDDD